MWMRYSRSGFGLGKVCNRRLGRVAMVPIAQEAQRLGSSGSMGCGFAEG
jgi:hypothetical protein